MTAPGVLVVGGAGSFGRRLVEGLARDGVFRPIVAGRDRARAAAVAAMVPAATALALDAVTVTPEALRDTGAFVVADAAGPFQGGAPRLAEAAIAAGLHYVDIADARDFVAGFPLLDAAARTAGVVALTGASSTPALSNAVLDRLTAGWSTVDAVEIAIAPGNRAPRGLSVMRAILSYAGRPVRVLQDGRWVTRPGWGMLSRRHLRGLGPRWLSLCETPDLDIVPQRFPGVRSVTFRAGLELPLLHLGLFAASLPVRLGLLRSLEPCAARFRTLADRFTGWGGDRGGMVVAATGRDAAGTPLRATWTLVAEAGDGPVIPTLPALAAIRALADGRLNRPGAMVCAGVLPLDAIAPEFAPYRIATHVEVDR